MIARRQNIAEQPNRAPRIKYARHGETWHNVDEILAGSTNAELTPKGIEQARKLGYHILNSNITVGKIITSGLDRTKHTAANIADIIGVDSSNIIALEELNERSGGGFEGKDLQEFYAATEEEIVAEGGESLEDLTKRAILADKKIRKISSKSQDGYTLVVGHAEIGRALDTAAMGLPPLFMPYQPKAPNAQLHPYPDLSEIPEYYARRGVILNPPAPNGWAVVGIENEKGEATELAEVQVDPGFTLKAGDKVHIGISIYGDPEDNQIVKIPQPAKKKWFAGRR